MDTSNLRETYLDIVESTLEAQLRAVRRLRTVEAGSGEPSRRARRSKEGMSQVEMAYDILSKSSPLHVNDLLAAIKEHFRVDVDRESLVSALSKRIARGDRFRRTAKNTFALLSSPQP